MKTSESIQNNNRCPANDCRGRIARDLKGLGHARHLDRKPNGEKCTYGLGERDTGRVYRPDLSNPRVTSPSL
jgi:hypothetical protein